MKLKITERVPLLEWMNQEGWAAARVDWLRNAHRILVGKRQEKLELNKKKELHGRDM